MTALIAVLLIAAACSKSKSSSDQDPPSPSPSPAPTTGSSAAPTPAPTPAATSSPECEQARDKYLAWSEARSKAAIGPADPEMKAELQAAADRELAQARDAFVPACLAMGSALDASCFDDKRAREPACKQMIRDLVSRLMARGR